LGDYFLEEQNFSINDISCEDVDFFENLGIHQKLKHKFIEIYLDIWANNVGSNSKKSIPTVDFFDLYAASGWAYDPHTEESWPGSALLAAKAFGEYPKGRLLFLNSYDQDSSKCQKQVEILQKSIKNIENCPHVIDKTKIISSDIREAADIALGELNRNFPSLWILDPYHPDQLPWEIVERISSTVGDPYENRASGQIIQKKPELIINLMTSVLQRNMDRKPELFSRAIGMSEDRWRPIYKEYERKYHEQGNEQCTRHVILDMYADRLSKLYNKDPIIALVNAAEGGVVYTMLLVTDNDAGYHMMRKRMHDWHNYKVYKWKSEAEASVFKKHNPDQSDLKKWF
jgi:three-Cys-motif partner protein